MLSSATRKELHLSYDSRRNYADVALDYFFPPPLLCASQPTNVMADSTLWRSFSHGDKGSLTAAPWPRNTRALVRLPGQLRPNRLPLAAKRSATSASQLGSLFTRSRLKEFCGMSVAHAPRRLPSRTSRWSSCRYHRICR